MKAGRLARGGILLGVALLLGYIESLVPLFPSLPGVKLGLSNTVLLYALYIMDRRWAWLLMAMKVALSALLFGTLFSGLYALAGGVLSMAAMTLILRSEKAGVVGVSVLGAAAHNIGQCGVACIFVLPAAVLRLLPPLLIAALAAGLVTGYIAKLVLKALSRSNNNN